MKATSTLFSAVLIVIHAGATIVHGQSAFTYQGRLQSSAANATGLYDFQFSIYNSQNGGSQIGPTIATNSIPISNGLFNVSLDFGTGMFSGTPRWLQIVVKTNAADAFTLLDPRQEITPAPEAMFAQTAATVPAGSLTSTQLAAGAVTGPIIANGQVVRSLNLLTEGIDIVPGEGLTLNTVGNTLQLGLLPPSCLTYSNCSWNLLGNGNITPGVNFFGTAAGETPLEFRVNNTTAMRYKPSSGTPNIIGGHGGNAMSAGVVGSIIAGGGHGGEPNSIQGDFATISGGRGNTISGGALGNTIGGGSLNSILSIGDYNTIAGGASNRTTRRHPAAPIYASIGGGFDNEVSGATSTIAGGKGNDIGGAAYSATIGGGEGNTIEGEALGSAIGGGEHNNIGGLSYWATIGGGLNNSIFLGGCATIPGGRDNLARRNAFAAGTQAKANNPGAFVWADSIGSDLPSTNDNSVTMRAVGGYRLFSDAGATNGVYLASGSGSWTTMSDRSMKENFATVSPREVLEKVAALRVQRWNYKSQDRAVRHIGPTAQDFKAAFEVGESDTGISTVDADGVALVAIQGLNQKLEERDMEIAQLKERLEKLEALLSNR